MSLCVCIRVCSICIAWVYPAISLLTLDDLLITRQVKQYKFLSNGETQVDGVDDAHMFGVTEVGLYCSYIELVDCSIRH